MHSHNFNLSLKELSKVEGAAAPTLKVEEGKVRDVQFAITEYKRFFTEALRGKAPAAVPPHLARICGTCSNAHTIAAIEACENALGITPTPQTRLLRALTMHGLMIRDHALHLYLFVLPDVYGKDAFLDFDENNPEEHQLLHDGFDIKGAGNYLATIIAGRSVHATYPVIGGFLHFPAAEEIAAAVAKLEAVRPAVLRLIEIFKKAPFHFDRQTKYMALVPDDHYGYVSGKILTSRGETYTEDQFRAHLEQVVLPYSQAPAFTYCGEDYMVGALARLNVAKEKLNDRTKQSLGETLATFPSTDVFHNNLAQAIEILHSLDQSIDILKQNKFAPEPVVTAPASAPDSGVVKIGMGVIEAPRGTLYHKIIINDGKVMEGEVVVPTGQNQKNIERDIATTVQKMIDDPSFDPNSKEAKEKINFEIEKLIRAYDPCMSCGAHFLKVKWE